MKKGDVKKMAILNHMIFILLVVCSIAAVNSKDLLSAVIIYSSYSLLMSVLWLLLAAPDVALTEASLGAALTSMLMITTIGRTRRYEK